MQQTPLKKFFILSGIIVGTIGIIIQFILFIYNRQTSIPEAIARFFTYFTILTNILVVIFFIGHLLQKENRFYHFVNKPETATALTIYIVVVGVVYQAVLRNLAVHEGWDFIADNIVHGFIPLLLLLFWIIFISTKKIQLKTIPYWLIYPALYLVLVFFRGSLSNYYPYPFMDVTTLGYKSVFINSGALVLFFLIQSFIFAAIANFRNKRKEYNLFKKKSSL
jgi:hypothetical protein